MSKIAILSVLIGTGLALCPAGTSARVPVPATASPLGTWINPHGTVKVSTGNCRGDLCGWVVWASPEALADGRDAGVGKLVGTEPLLDYRATAPGHWRGEVYVPDMGRRFSSIIAQIDENRLKISGCILAGLICKSQIWKRA